MRRALLLGLGIVAIIWLEYQFFPGHTYLQSDTQIYLPILQRLDAPGYLSRDIVAAHPHVSYTVYDEVTLFLHAAGHLDFEKALVGQQLLYRAAGVLGVFLIVLATGLGDLFAFLMAALFGLGAALLGPAVLLAEYEPVPRAFAFGLVVLAIGLLVHDKPLLAGLSGALAFLYHPPTAAPLWGVILLAFLFDKRLRFHLRPSLVILFVAVLLLGNLAQLQPGAVDSQGFFRRVSDWVAEIQNYRTKYVWVRFWAGTDIWHYLFLWICGVWASTRIWPTLNRPMRWFFAVLPVAGILSVPVSYVLLEHFRWALIPEMQPARMLLFTVFIASLSCGMAGFRAISAGRLLEAWLWFVVVLALPMRVCILDLLRVTDAVSATQLAISLVLAAALVLLLRSFRPLALLVPVAAIFVMPTIGHVQNYPKLDKQPIIEVARWAEKNTWGSSMFLFPDAGHELYPGIFRAYSRRALWVDWKSGGQVNYFEPFANDWWTRWKQTMDGHYSAKRLENMLPLPIDYYVLKRENRLANANPVFANSEFSVYDASDLRNSSTSLRSGIED